MAEIDRNQKMTEIQSEALHHREASLFQREQDRYGIYQIQDGSKGDQYRFMGMSYLQKQGLSVDGEDYQFIYGDELKEEDTLESIYKKFNIDHPADYTGHSLSVSDIVVLKKDGKLTAHYVDSFGYHELPDFVQQRMAINEIHSERKDYPPLYLSDLSYAMEHGNVDAYLDSRKLNLDCKQAIEMAIKGHFDGYHLAHDVATDVVEAYGSERVSFVLACTVQHRRADGRFSKETKEWADSFIIPKNISRGSDLNADYVVTSHPAVLDGFIDLARDEMLEHGLEEEKLTGQISPETKGLFVDGHFGTWHTAEVKEIAGEPFFRMEHDEYGHTVAGIIVNGDGKLVAEDLEHGFDVGAMEAITEYLYEKVPEPVIKHSYVVNDTYGEKALGGMSRSEIEEAVLCYAQAQLEDMGLADEVKLKAARVYGSRTREGLYNDGSDLDVVLAYTGNIREDDFFSALHKAGMAIAGIPLDIKPVSEDQTCTLDEYMKNAEKYLDDKELKKLASDIDQFSREYDPYEYGDTVDNREENVEMIYADLVSREAESIRKWVAEISEGKNDDLPEVVESAKKLLTRIEQAQETGRAEIMHEPEAADAKITFYVAECMEFPVMGEYYDNLTLEEALRKYQEIPPGRLNAIKGIGFRLEDGSMYGGDYELMRGGVISKDLIDLVPHYKESPLVQKAIKDLEQILSQDRQMEIAEEPEQKKTPDKEEKGVRQSVLAALREHQAKQKAQEQQVQKEEQKTKKKTQGHRKGEAEI